MRFNQQTDSSSHTLKRSILGLFAMFICALFAAGCSSGGSDGGFVANPTGAPAGGGNGGGVGNGSVTFNFVRQQSNPIVVPAATVQLRFEFFNGLQGTGTILKRETRDFASSITIADVSTSVRSTKVTAITADGFPIAEFTANVTIPADGNVIVNATDGVLTPVNAVRLTSSPQSVDLGNSDTFQLQLQVEFSNGDRVDINPTSGLVTFVSSQTGVATVNGNGLITAGLNGTSVVTATLNATGFSNVTVDIPVRVGDGENPPPTVTGIEIIAPAGNLSLPQGTMSEPIVVQATFLDVNGNTTTRVITQENGLVLSSNRAPDVTVDSATQRVIVAANAPVSQTARITATFNGEIDFFDVTVNAAQLQSITVEPSTVNLPYGGFTTNLVVRGSFTDGSNPQLPSSVFNITPNTFQRFAIAEINGNLVLTTATTAANPAAGTETVTFTHQNGPVATLSVTVGSLTVTGLNIDPSPLTGDAAMVPGQQQLFTVTATLSNGAEINISTLAGLVLTSDQPDNVAVSPNEARITAVAPTLPGDPAEITFTLRAAGAGGNNFVSNPISVEVLAEVIDLSAGLRYDFAGNDIANFRTVGGLNVANLPRGYVGVIEVFATFNSGVQRRLRPGEYEIILGPEGQFPGGDNIKLWQTDGVNPGAPSGDFYSHPATNPAFSNSDNNTPPFDAMYFRERIVEAASLAMDPTGSTYSGYLDFAGTPQGVVLTRRTFRAVVADWRREERAGGHNDLVGTPVANVLPSAPSPGSSRSVTVRLSPFVLPAGTMPEDEDFNFRVTITDPPTASIVSASFVGTNAEDGRTPVATVREFEVRANFGAVDVNSGNSPDGIELGAQGPTVAELSNFKLAEANVHLISDLGGATTFARSAPTDLGFLGIFSATSSVAENVINVRAIPVGGDNIRPVRSKVGQNTPDDDEYLYVNNIFGVYSGGLFQRTEGPAVVRETDPADSESAPSDGVVRVFQELTDSPVEFSVPELFSIDPPTVDASTPTALQVGASQRFRTVVQWVTGGPYIDVSEDYPPVMFASTADPAFSSRLADPAVDTGSGPGNIFVTALRVAGAVLTSADLDLQTGDTLLSSEVGMIGATTQALVVALDAAGSLIPFTGQFSAPGAAQNPPDLRGLDSPARAVSALRAVDN